MIPNCGIARFARVSLGKTEPKTSIAFHDLGVGSRSHCHKPLGCLAVLLLVNYRSMNGLGSRFVNNNSKSLSQLFRVDLRLITNE
jgi:hypothetical protein